VKQGAVREVSQEVMQATWGELSLERLAFPDVTRREHDLADGRVVEEVGRDRFHLAPNAG